VGDDRYRLAPIRDARERAERSRKHELADAVATARTSEAALTAAQARVAAARTAIATARFDSGPAASAARADRYAARRRREHQLALAELDHVAAAHDREDAAVTAARGTLARARADREVIERHFARWRDERRKLADRRED
jgi:hypothetical protein